MAGEAHELRCLSPYFWFPSETTQIDPAALIEHHTFLFEKVSLKTLATAQPAKRSLADFTTRVDHPVPGNIGTIRQRAQRITDLTRMTRPPGECRDLSVGGNPTLRDALHHLVDALVTGIL